MLSLKSKIEENIEALCRAAKGPVGVAVSGGSDSLALLYLANDWAVGTGRSLYVMTVDHGLRREAAQEASEVARQCAVLGWPHQTLNWTPPKGKTSQERARRARHALLADALRMAGGTHLLMGHTRDDQIETAVMRASRRGAGSVAGTAGMRTFSVSPVWPEGRSVFVARPCLEVSREALREELRARLIAWIDDPSNENEMFERVRVRKALARGADASTQHLDSAGAKRKVQDRALADWLNSDVIAHDDGLVSCGPGGLGANDLAEGLAWVIMAAAGTDTRADRTGRLALAGDILARPGKWRGRTLGGAWIGPRQGSIHIARDPGLVPDGDTRKNGIWDGRFDLSGVANASLQLLDADTMANTLRAISPMARPGWPIFAGVASGVQCLVPQRLRDIRSMLDYESLIAGAPR